MTQKRALDVAGGAPLGKLHYTLLFWCSFIMLFDGYDLVIYGSVVPRLMEEWALTPVVAGWMGSAALFGMMFGAVVVGPQADRLGRRKVVIGSVALASLCALGTAFTWDAPSFALLRFITGVGLGGAIPNIVALMNDLAPTSRRSSLTTIMLSFYSIGAMISALVAMWIIPRYGWEATFIIGGVPLLLLPWLARQLPESLHYLLEKDRAAAGDLLTRIDPQVDTSSVSFEAPPRTSSAAPLSRLFAEGRGVGTVFLWLGFGMCMLMVYGLNTWLPKIMVAGGFELGSSLMFLVTLNIGATFGALGGGWLADRWGCKPTLMLFFLLAVVSLCTLGIKPGPLLLNAMLLVAGATTIGTLAVIHAFAAQQYPSEIRSTGVSWCSAIGRFGGVAGPALGGLMLSLNLPLQLNFILCAVPGVVAILAIAMIRQRNVAGSAAPGRALEARH
ncbi:aromatic acid/H+ symport family MFS transporter [Pseudomonas putida CSV86]|uniref:Aromatic acid/H+ symport family MFS transporter n=1 Tax=Pseudomonas bharatica CSV86 TaxID=1005395 RepID=L1M134_9PSED|nr:aromatic acid/H+ symport family MFS transporter [Pseudomonas bharatica]NNJ16958.1 aromatic acid/H+ symport family MFS transporter [Pseudomonas bharatica CSV86]